MAFKYNGNDPKKIFYTGYDVNGAYLTNAEVKEVKYYNDVVWKRSNPVYWYNGSSYGVGYPTNWTVTSTDVDCNDPEDCEIYYRTDIHDIYANHHEPWSLTAQATGNTGDNETMEIVVSGVQYGSLSIAGASKTTTITSAGTYKIDVSGLSTVTMTASLGGHEYAVGSIPISSIRFY